MARKKLGWQSTSDWSVLDGQRARCTAHKLKASLPDEWAHGIDAMRPAKHLPAYQHNHEWAEKLDAFRQAHGTALAWQLSDAEVCDRAWQVAHDCSILLADMALYSLATRVDLAVAFCRSAGVEPPAVVLGEGAVNRVCCERWWRRVLRKHVARVVELGAIRLGVVNAFDGGYASNDAVRRRAQQQARNAAYLNAALLKNEAGQVYRLGKLAALSAANPEIRRAELMQRIRGAEEYATERGHVGHFYTLTCPSRFHAVNKRGFMGQKIQNEKYEGASPREAQQWLRTMWARVRAAWARESIEAYGVRVAEPHADGCPHWHALLFFADGRQAGRAWEIVRGHWLSDAGDEQGAAKNRCKVIALTSGGAAAYVAKYVAKNLTGSGHVAQHIDGDAAGEFGAVYTGDVTGAHRVDAWAATWGIRQFQTIGMPPVGVWRLLRRVDKGQADDARQRGDMLAWQAWMATHRIDAVLPFVQREQMQQMQQTQRESNVLACWRTFMVRMGGACAKRAERPLAVAVRMVKTVNDYGEQIERRIAFGVRSISGLCLISKRQQWGAATAADAVAYEALGDGEKRGKAATWSGFNNCTARLTGSARRAFFEAAKIEGLGRRQQIFDGVPVW